MKRPRTRIPPRPSTLTRRTARTRPEAAAELVRLEYERDRVERDLAMLQERHAHALAALERLDVRARKIQHALCADQRPSARSLLTRLQPERTQP